MAKGDDDQHAAESDERGARLPSEDHQRAGNQLDEWDHVAHRPKRPGGKEGVLEREEESLHVSRRAELEGFPDAGHEEDEAENEAGEENCPGARARVANHSPRISAKNASLETGRPKNRSTSSRAGSSLPRLRIISRNRRPVSAFMTSGPKEAMRSSAITFAHM